MVKSLELEEEVVVVAVEDVEASGADEVEGLGWVSDTVSGGGVEAGDLGGVGTRVGPLPLEAWKGAQL